MFLNWHLTSPITAGALRGAALGLGAAAPIGPVNVEIARRTLRGGFGAGLALGCGAVSVDVFYVVLSGATSLRLHDTPLMKALAWGGIGLLLLLAFLSIRGAAVHWRADPLEALTPVGSRRSAYVTGVAMTLLNPMTLVFWFSVVPMLLGSIAQEPARDLPMIALGVLLGTLSWVCVFAGALAAVGRFRRRWWLVLADGAGGVILLCFAAGGVWRLCTRGL